MQLLFETPEAAREVAFMLQCEYDGFTMTTLLSVHDTLALRTAIALTGTDFCFAGDHCPLVLVVEANALTQVSASQQAERISRKAELWKDVAPF
ncbi:MAG: hypothetical protein ACAF41_33740 (plasmid) [Leptolyngbya sp. BL-A-14]